MLNRAWDSCSKTELFNKEVEKLTTMFGKNGYPYSFIKTTIEKFKTSKLSEKSTDRDKEITGIVIKIPYIGKKSVDFGKKLAAIFDQHLDSKITPVFTSSKVQSHFKLKSVTPAFLTSNVVYEFVSSCDTSVSYIGVTTRPLWSRVQEHIDCSAKNKLDSAIKKHIMHCQKCFTETKSNPLKNFTVIRSCHNQYDAKIHEALLIKQKMPKLNIQQHNSGSSFLLEIF